MTNLVDELLVCPNEKMLTNLNRQIAGDPDPKSAADIFRGSTWAVAAVSGPRKQSMVLTLLAAAKALHLSVPLLISIDDSLGKKDPATRHLEAVDFHHNHNEGSSKKPKFANGFVYVEVHLQLGPIGCTFDLGLYLSEKTVRRLFRQKDGAHQIKQQVRTDHMVVGKACVPFNASCPAVSAWTIVFTEPTQPVLFLRSVPDARPDQRLV